MTSIKERMRSEKLAPGDPLPSENALALEFGVSRAVIREAFRSLAALKLIDVGGGRRARVSAIDPDVLGLVLDHAVHTKQITIQQIYDVRRTIEMRTVALAALRRADDEAASIVELADAMARDFDNPDHVMRHDIAFHEAIARASRNPLFALVVGSFHIVTRQTWGIGWASRPNDAERMASVACHRSIARAIADRDPRVAGAAMADHFDLSVKWLLAAGVN